MDAETRQEYTCSLCGVTFIAEWSDADANAEAEELWGIKEASTNRSMAVVCDDCWQKIKPKPFKRG